MKKPLILALTLISTSLQAQTYTQLQWGVNKATTPYQFGANINGTWSNLGTVSSAGVWQIPAANLSGIPTLAGANIWTGLNTFNGGIYQTTDPISYTFLGVIPSKVGLLQDIIASEATKPDIGAIFQMESSVGYSSDPATNAARFKLPLFSLVNAKPGSSTVWAANFVAQMQSGVGLQSGLVGLEIDMNNFNRDFTGPIAYPYAVGLLLTGTNAGAKINNAGVLVSGSSPIWDYGFVTNVESAIFPSIVTAAFADLDSRAPISFISSGNHNVGLNLTGTYAQYSIAAPNFTVTNAGAAVANTYNASSAIGGYSLNGAKTLYDNGSFVVVSNTSATVQSLLLGVNTNYYSADTHSFRNSSTATQYLTMLSTGATFTYGAANALIVGPNGNTNPAFNVDSSTASSATGVKVTSKAAASGVNLTAISSGSNENLAIDAKGSGLITLNATATGAVKIGGVANGALTLVSTGGPSGAITLSPASSTAAYTATLPANTGTIAETNLAQTFTADQTFSAPIKLTSYTIGTLPTCNAGAIGSLATVSDGTAYAVGTYGSAVSATGIVTRQVLCTNTAGATTYAWAYN